MLKRITFGLMIAMFVGLLSSVTTGSVVAKNNSKAKGSHEKVTGEITATAGGTTFWMEITAHDTDPAKGYVKYSNSLEKSFEGPVDCYKRVGDDEVVFGGTVFASEGYPSSRYFVEVKNGDIDRLRVRIDESFTCDEQSYSYPGIVTEGDIVIHEATTKNHSSGAIIDNKWNMSGSFVSSPTYDWGGLAENATWNYHFSIKQSLDLESSVGSIHFKTDDINVVGHVKDFKVDYPYWGSHNIAAVGITEYDGEEYNFMFLYSKRAVWFAISKTDYEVSWSNGVVWSSSDRAYQLHSLNTNDFSMEYMDIH